VAIFVWEFSGPYLRLSAKETAMVADNIDQHRDALANIALSIPYAGSAAAACIRGYLQWQNGQLRKKNTGHGVRIVWPALTVYLPLAFWTPSPTYFLAARVETTVGSPVLDPGHDVYLRTVNGPYLGARPVYEQNTLVIANLTRGQPRSRWHLGTTGNAFTTGVNVFLQLVDDPGYGYYLSAEGGGDSILTANRPWRAGWEHFQLLVHSGGQLATTPGSNGQISLRAANGHWVSPQAGGGNGVLANGPNGDGGWEPLTVEFA
jgi:hypothetical protein